MCSVCLVTATAFTPVIVMALHARQRNEHFCRQGDHLCICCLCAVGPGWGLQVPGEQNRETQIKHWGTPRLDMLVARAGSLASDQQR